MTDQGDSDHLCYGLNVHKEETIPLHCVLLPLFTVETWEFHHIWALTRRSSYIHETSVGIKYLGSKNWWMKIKRPALMFKVSLTGLLTSGCDLHIWSWRDSFKETAVKRENESFMWEISPLRSELKLLLLCKRHFINWVKQTREV